MLEEDFIPQTTAAQLKLKQVKELNKVLEDLRSNITDMQLDPVQLKEERDNYLRENEGLRAERDYLLARLEKKDKIGEVDAYDNGPQDFLQSQDDYAEEEVDEHEGEEEGVHQVGVGNQQKAIGCEVAYGIVGVVV